MDCSVNDLLAVEAKRNLFLREESSRRKLRSSLMGREGEQIYKDWRCDISTNEERMQASCVEKGVESACETELLGEGKNVEDMMESKNYAGETGSEDAKKNEQEFSSWKSWPREQRTGEWLPLRLRRAAHKEPKLISKGTKKRGKKEEDLGGLRQEEENSPHNLLFLPQKVEGGRCPEPHEVAKGWSNSAMEELLMKEGMKEEDVDRGLSLEGKLRDDDDSRLTFDDPFNHQQLHFEEKFFPICQITTIQDEEEEDGNETKPHHFLLDQEDEFSQSPFHNIQEELQRLQLHLGLDRWKQLGGRVGPAGQQKSLACPFCEKRYWHASTLKTHVRVHTGERPFACTLCVKRFSDASNLRTHMRTHTGERPFACTLCDKRFGRSNVLKRHLQTHSGLKPFACTLCGKRFGRRSNAQKHLQNHTGEKPFVCTLCNKRFSTTSHLKRHLRTHSGGGALHAHTPTQQQQQQQQQPHSTNAATL